MNTRRAWGRSGSAPVSPYVDAGVAMFRFTMKDVVRTFGISRSTILYYESIGVISPQRDENSRYRLYTEADVFRLMSASFMKGLGIAPKELPERLERGVYTEDSFREYLEMADRKLTYALAVRSCLVMLNELRLRVGEIDIAEVEPYYICWDRAEGGYKDFPGNDNLDLLMAHMPLASLGSYGDDSYVGTDVSIRWGRTVAVKHAHLIEGLRPDVGMDVLGGCRCVCFRHFEHNLYDMTKSQTFARTDGDRIMAFMAEHHVHRSGVAFWPYTLPSSDGFYVLTCIPIEED